MARYLFWSFWQCLCVCVMVCVSVCVCALLCVFMWFEGERYLFVCSSDRCRFWPEHFSLLLQRIIACPKTVSFSRKSNKSQVLIIARIRKQKKGNERKETRQTKAAEQQQICYSYMYFEQESLIHSLLIPPPHPFTYQITHLTVSAAACVNIFVHIPRVLPCVPASPYWVKFNWLIVRVFAELIYLTIDCAMRNN